MNSLKEDDKVGYDIQKEEEETDDDSYNEDNRSSDDENYSNRAKKKVKIAKAVVHVYTAEQMLQQLH